MKTPEQWETEWKESKHWREIAEKIRALDWRFMDGQIKGAEMLLAIRTEALREAADACNKNSSKNNEKCPECERLQRENVILRDLLKKARAAFGHEHWDSTQQRGIGCPMCIRQHEVSMEIESLTPPTTI